MDGLGVENWNSMWDCRDLFVAQNNTKMQGWEMHNWLVAAQQ